MTKRKRNISLIVLALMAIILAVDASPSSRIHAASLLFHDDWPLETGLRYHFFRTRANFDYLAEVMAANPDYRAIYAGGKSLFKETCVSTDLAACPASTDEKLRRHVKKSGVFAVVNHGDTFLFGVGYYEVGDTLYTYGFARSDHDRISHPSCNDVIAEEIEFICVLPLDGVWYIQYSTWIEEEMSSQEINRTPFLNPEAGQSVAGSTTQPPKCASRATHRTPETEQLTL